MDYRQRAGEVRNYLNDKLNQAVEDMTLSTVTPGQIITLGLQNKALATLGLQILVVERYIAFVREEVPQTSEQAKDHFIYAVEAVVAETGHAPTELTMLRYQLTDEDYVVPKVLTRAVRQSIIQDVKDVLVEAIKPKDVVVLIEGYDRDTPIYLLHNGKQIGSANYDEHASAGMEALQETAESLAKSLGVELQVVNSATEEYEDDCKALGLNPEEYR